MKHTIFSILSFLFVFNLIGQDAEVTLSIDPVSADIGEIITITIKSNVQGEVEIDNLPSSFVHGYDVMNGMEQEMDYNTGKVITFFYVSQTGAIGKKGKYTIGPAYIKKGNKTYQSNSVVVNIGEKSSMSSGDITAKQLKEPAFGIIQTNKKTIFEGESIIVLAKIYSHFEPTHLEGYRSYEFPGTVDKKLLGNVKRIVVEEERFRNQKLYSFEYDKHIIFPSGTGQFKISPYTMKLNHNYKGFQFKSNHTIIEIKPLPPNPPNDFIGAVGHFTIVQEIEETFLKQGDVFKMLIRIIGSGNLQNIVEPSPTLPKGFIVYGDPEIEEEYIYNAHGTEGEISYKYNIQVNKPGVTTLPATTVSFFDPNKEEYITVATEECEVKVEKVNNYITEEEEIEDTNEGEMGSFMRRSKLLNDNSSFFGSNLYWIGISSPILFAFLFILFIKRRENNSNTIEEAKNVKKKSNQLASMIERLKHDLHSNNDSDYFSQVEKTLCTAIEIKLNISDSLSKQELFKQLSNQPESLQSAKDIFLKCDQYRYGFTSSIDSKQQLYNELQQLLSKLKS